jgi:2'-5' RNA ligase
MMSTPRLQSRGVFVTECGMLRLFSAIEIPPEIGEELEPHMDDLDGARWRDAESLHITLRFFGETPEPVADDLDAELSQVTGAPFDLTLTGTGSFGVGHQSRAIWAGVEPLSPLKQLAGRCEAAARRAGLAAETRVFKPHVTLAYVRGLDPHGVASWTVKHNLLRTSPFRVTWFGLYSSRPGAAGGDYTLEKEYPLL